MAKGKYIQNLKMFYNGKRKVYLEHYLKGKVNVNSEPTLGVLVADKVPLCASIIFLTMARPNPVDFSLPVVFMDDVL